MRWYVRVPLKLALFVGACAAFTLGSYLILSKGITVEVPDVRGKSLKDAGLLLMERGMEMKIDSDRYDREVAVGHVIDQSVPPRTQVRGRLLVKVIVSKGPEVRLIPSVLGMRIEEAKNVFFDKDVALGSIIHTSSPTALEGVIIAQHPAPEAWAGEAVNLVVSSGPRDIIYSCPLFVGKSKADAVLIASALGLQAEFRGPETGSVSAQSPDEGSAIKRGSAITLTVGGRR